MNNLKVAIRGYDQHQVDALLKQDADQIGALKAQLQFKENELEKLRAELEALKGRESRLGDTLMLAQRTADEVIAAAHQESARLLEEGKKKAEEAGKDAKSTIENLKWDVERLRLEKQNFINSFRTLLEGHLRELAEANRGLSVIQGDAAAAPAAIETPPIDDVAQA